MGLKRIWPKLLIISSVIVILCVIVLLKPALEPEYVYIENENKYVPLIEAQKYDQIYRFLILLSIVISSMITVGCAQLFKEPDLLLTIPFISQLLAMGLMYPYRWWSPYMPGGAEFGFDFLFTSLFFIWIGGSLLAAILYVLYKDTIGAEALERRKWVYTNVGIASLVLGIFSLIMYFSFTVFIFGPLAILSGAVAWSKDKDIYGLAGIILGIISIVGWILYAV